MDLSRRNGRRRPRIVLNPVCEALDSRQLLSTVPTVALSLPPASAVANAAADLNALAPTTFAQLQSDMARAEAHSRVTPSQASKLDQDEAALDQDIQSAGLDANTTASDMNRVLNVVDESFVAATYRAKTWAGRRQILEQYVPAAPGSSQLIDRTMAQMHVIARAAKVTGQFHEAIYSDDQILSNDLGPNPDTDLGPGATDRDPLTVYHDGQVNNFIKD